MSDNGQNANILLITSDQQHHTARWVFEPKIKTPCLTAWHVKARISRAYCPPNPTCTQRVSFDYHWIAAVGRRGHWERIYLKMLTVETPFSAMATARY